MIQYNYSMKLSIIWITLSVKKEQKKTELNLTKLTKFYTSQVNQKALFIPLKFIIELFFFTTIVSVTDHFWLINRRFGISRRKFPFFNYPSLPNVTQPDYGIMNLIRPDFVWFYYVWLRWFAVTRVCFFKYTRPVGKILFYHFVIEKIALILIYNIVLTKKVFFRNKHQKKNFDPHVSCRPGRVTANQHICKSGLFFFKISIIWLLFRRKKWLIKIFGWS